MPSLQNTSGNCALSVHVEHLHPGDIFCNWPIISVSSFDHFNEHSKRCITSYQQVLTHQFIRDAIKEFYGSEKGKENLVQICI